MTSIARLQQQLVAKQRLQIAELVEALRPLARFAEVLEGKQLPGVGETLYACHPITGRAELNRSDCEEALRLVRAYDLEASQPDRPRRSRRVLTGRELRVAAEKGLPVRYVDHPFDPGSPRTNEVCVMEPAPVGYYIGPSDIDPDEFDDLQEVSEEYPEGMMWVYAVPGVNYEREES